MFRSLLRVLKFAFQNFFRNFWLSFVSMTVFALTLLTVNAVIFMNLVATRAIQTAEDQVEVTIYFTPEASEDIVKAAQGYLLGLPQVRDARFISKEDELAQFQARHEGNEVILGAIDEVGGNPFVNAIAVSAQSPDDFPFILEAVETPEFSPYIKDKTLKDYEGTIQNIRTLRDRIQIGGIVLASFFGLIAIMIIFNTIRVAIYVHRDEIGIMKLVGANDWFVRGPFLLEAILYSLLATAVVSGSVLLLLGALKPRLIAFFGDVNVDVQAYFLDHALLIFGGQFLALSLLSLLTTASAMRRYLRV